MDYDPTRIDIETDPLTQRMRGIAYHGNTPFDVPFISHIEDNLYTGGCENYLFLPLEIEHVISLYPWEQYDLHDNVQTNLSIRMYDDSNGPNVKVLNRIADWAIECLNDGPTLIHCQAGLNRSALVAAYTLIRSGQYSPVEAIKILRDSRSPAVLCNKTFENWLLDLYEQEDDESELKIVKFIKVPEDSELW